MTETTPRLTIEMTVTDPGALAEHPQLKAPGQHATSQRGQQMAMDNFVRPLVRQCPPSRVSEINDLIVDMVATDMLPLAFVNGPGFNGVCGVSE